MPSRHLQAILQERGFSAVLLSGELGQHERNLSMQALRDGRARVCVATDVAARGLDLPTVALVIHADFPHDVEALETSFGPHRTRGPKRRVRPAGPAENATAARKTCSRRRR